MIYVASPYSHKDSKMQELRYEKTMKFVAEEMKKGVQLFSPIVYCHPLALRYELPKDAAFWWNFNKSMLDCCEDLYLFALSGWRLSKGVIQEIEYWTETNAKPIYYIDPTSYEKTVM